MNPCNQKTADVSISDLRDKLIDAIALGDESASKLTDADTVDAFNGVLVMAAQHYSKFASAPTLEEIGRSAVRCVALLASSIAAVERSNGAKIDSKIDAILNRWAGQIAQSSGSADADIADALRVARMLENVVCLEIKNNPSSAYRSRLRYLVEQKKLMARGA